MGPEFLARALLPKIMKPIIQPAQEPMTHVNFKRKKKTQLSLSAVQNQTEKAKNEGNKRKKKKKGSERQDREIER